ncbi:MAG TPA: DUF711 family protein [Thermomicrobiaceae bacterium]|nr:DUF711 family protein [Thermomicrobiaceae bacterium]
MEIRAVTVGTQIAHPDDAVVFDRRVPGFIDSARLRFRDAGLTVQTARIAAQPFPSLVPADRDAVVGLARAFERTAREAGFGYVSLGPAGRSTLQYVPHLVEAILATEHVFGTVVVGDRADGVSLEAAAAAADVVESLAQRSAEGFANLRFAALANCPPGIPFFPAGYHDGGPTTFAVAWQAADLAVDAFEASGTIADARRRLLELVEREGRRVAATAALLAEQHELTFTGIDLSLAPAPDEAGSIGAAFERLGVDVFGAPGTLFIASLVTDVLRRADLPATGYSGLMLPVLEDVVLGRRAAQGTYTVNDLLLYSAVCGLGLDVVPLPGDTGIDDLRGLLLDVATLATRLDKPLSARLMPLPGKQAGDPVGFDDPYFVPAAVLPVKGRGAGRLFAREGF